MIIIEDKAQKEGKHDHKIRFWKSKGIEIMRCPLPVGDYILGTAKVMDVISRKEKRGIALKKMDFLGTYDTVVDTKQSIQELESDICGKQHERFRDECILAANNNIRLYILIENEDGINKLSELHKWVNPRLWIKRGGKRVYPHAVRGVSLMKACMTMQHKYGCEFLFCTPEEAGKVIIDILGENYEAKS